MNSGGTQLFQAGHPMMPNAGRKVNAKGGLVASLAGSFLAVLPRVGNGKGFGSMLRHIMGKPSGLGRMTTHGPPSPSGVPAGATRTSIRLVNAGKAIARGHGEAPQAPLLINGLGLHGTDGPSIVGLSQGGIQPEGREH